MKPDKIICQQCGKEIDRGKWCSDKCRKAFTRNPEQTRTEDGQNPDISKSDTEKDESRTNSDIRDSLTKTDKTFYDRAMKDFSEPYYKFTDNLTEKTCKHCGVKFKTGLSLLQFCSYAHYTEALSTGK